jgi:predicted AAA+ superfamily ATPase
VWLTGVRRVGKTTLAKHWDGAEYFNCDLPRNQRALEDPEHLFRQITSGAVVLDEVHQLRNPSEVLKIGADEFPHLKILATGSSTLAATRKFRDSLTGRKRVVHLTPVLVDERSTFGVRRLEDRLLRGGLPDRLLSDEADPEFYGEWLDSYFARDVQELYAVGKRGAFLRLCELLLRQSGQLLEVTSLAKHCGLSRPTVMQYLEVMEATHVIHLLRPFHGGGRREIIAQPKAYGFDTGFVCHTRGWEQLRAEDCGLLLEHVVLDLLRAYQPQQKIQYWRDKQQREIDFVLPGKKGHAAAIECKWSATAFSTRNLDAFRDLYPEGRNIVVVAGTGERHARRIGRHRVEVCSAEELPQRLMNETPSER